MVAVDLHRVFNFQHNFGHHRTDSKLELAVDSMVDSVVDSAVDRGHSESRDSHTDHCHIIIACESLAVTGKVKR